MIKQITFNKTGNFWIDNGIVSLYRLLKASETEKVSITLTSSRLLLEILEELNQDEKDIIIKELNKAKNQLQKFYFQKRNNTWLYKDGEFELIWKDSFQLFLKPFIEGLISQGTSMSIPNIEVLAYEKESNNDLTEKILVYDGKKENIIIYTLNKIKEDNETRLIDVSKEIILNKDIELKPKKDKPTSVVIRNGTIISKEPKSNLKDKKNTKVMETKYYGKYLEFMEENKKSKFSTPKIGVFEKPLKISIGKDFETGYLKKATSPCSYSGEFLKTIEAKGVIFPFLVGKGKGDNFASMLKEKPKISAKYAFTTLFAPYSTYYSIGEDKKAGGKSDYYYNYFMLFDTDLKQLDNFHNKIDKDLKQLEKNTYCNFKSELEKVSLKFQHENLFNFILSVFRQTYITMSKDERKEIFTKSIYMMTYDGTFYREVTEYNSLHQLFDFFNKIENFNAFKSLVANFQKTKEKNGKKIYNTIWRDKLCTSILSFQSISKVIEKFLGEIELVKDTKKENYINLYYLKEFLSIYNQTFLNMTKETIDLCHTYGVRIGNYCADSERKRNGSLDKGLLFAIRNAKNRKSLLNILSESQFKTEIYFHKDFFNTLFLDENDWEEHKSLLSIFAMNQFIFLTKPKKNENE